MTANELELVKLIRESECPEKVAEYMFNLFSDYLQKLVPLPGNDPVALLG